jgi:hypothetical protein
MIDWPLDLVDDIAARRSVLFLGAGVSRNAKNSSGSHPREWSAYLNHLAALLPDTGQRDEILQCVKEGDLLTACELAKDHLSAATFKTELVREYSGNGYSPVQIHDDLSQIDSRIVMTTNFDKLYEVRANVLQNHTVLIKNYYDPDLADVFRRRDRVVLKAHGSIDSAERTIFTRSEYAKARRDHAHFYQVLRGLFLTHTFLFLGASLRDPDIQLLLEDNAYRFEGTRPHYIAMPKDSTRNGLVRVMERTMNLKALLYDAADDHKELADSVAALVPLVDLARRDMARTAGW